MYSAWSCLILWQFCHLTSDIVFIQADKYVLFQPLFCKNYFISIVGLKGWMSTLWYESSHQSHLHIIQHFLLVIWVINFAIFCYWNLLWLNLLTRRVWLPYTQPHFLKFFCFFQLRIHFFSKKVSRSNLSIFIIVVVCDWWI